MDKDPQRQIHVLVSKIQQLRAEKEQFAQEAVRWAEEAGKLSADLRDAKDYAVRKAAETLSVVHQREELIEEVERLKALLHDAQRGAERYRWLRSMDGRSSSAACVNFNIGHDWIEQHGEDLDAAIDAAMAAEREGA